ncbi:MAG: exonuclease domain-containing protein [Polyangiaceae bacterium]|jgi:DNA polymerase III subunit epsilon
MKSVVVDGCGCFPTGRLYPGIAHLLRSVVRGLVEEFAQDMAWHDIPIALIDVETTGRDASVDRVVEVGIVIARHGLVTSRYNWLLNPGVAIPAEVSAIHGIKDEDVKDSPRFAAVAHEIAAALSGCVPAAYNAAFDRAFIVGEFARAGDAVNEATAKSAPPALRKDVEWIDPLVWAREIQQGEKSRALGEVAARLGVKLENAHRASDDAEAAALVLYSLAQSGKIPAAYGALVQEQRRLALMHADERRRWKQFS